MVDCESTECAVFEDYQREMGVIRSEEDGVTNLNTSISRCLGAGSTSIKLRTFEVDSYACGEPESFREQLAPERVPNALVAAASGGHMAAVEELLNGPHSSNVGNLGLLWEPLWLACAGGFANVAAILLEHGSNINLPDPKNGRTALWKSSLNGRLETVQLLIKRGACVHTPKKTDGATPLFVASEYGFHTVVSELLAAGADPNAPKLNGDTALLAACRGGHMKTVKLLIDSERGRVAHAPALARLESDLQSGAIEASRASQIQPIIALLRALGE